MAEALTIVGGGLAGLALGIGLRQRAVPVTVWESGHYPRHRVCGEFISGRGQGSLGRLGLLEAVRQAGGRPAASAAFFAGKTIVPACALPQPALCISRFILDEFLAGEFQRLGGNLQSGQRWIGSYGRGIVRATGRRPEAVASGWRLFGLKVHGRGIPMAADLELHFVPEGYVGLCRLANGEVNICGLFRSKTTQPGLAEHWRDWLCGPDDSVLRSRFADATLDERSFCSVAGVSLRRHQAVEREECCVGDALTMIPPLTGNGMSMAFESAESAIEPLARFSQGTVSWPEAQRQIALACDEAFARRLRWSAWLQRLLFQPLTRAVVSRLVANSAWCWRMCFERTR